MKKIILCIDGFGTSKEINGAVLDGYHKGYLKSVSIPANGLAFSPAVNDILPECTDLDVGIQLNITANKALTNCHLLTNCDGEFNGGFLYFYLNSSNRNFMQQLEKELRAQIEQVQLYSKISFITSLSAIHLIPNIFKLCIKLAEDYKIPFIRTYNENFYFVSNYKKYFNLKFPLNIIKTLVLNILSYQNKSNITNSKIKTNDFTLGTLYSGINSADTIECGIKMIVDKNNITEFILSSENFNTKTDSDFTVITDKEIEYLIIQTGFDITSYREFKHE